MKKELAAERYLRITTGVIRGLSIFTILAIVTQLIVRLVTHSLPQNDLSNYLVDKLFSLLAVTFTFVLSYVPTLLNKNKIYLPPGLQIAIVLFAFGATFLGEFLGFYQIFPWWDKMLHGISGVLIALIGFSLVYLINKSAALNIRLSAGFVALFAFNFSLAGGAIWEIFEFVCDQTLGTNMQRWRGGTGLLDTMTDLIVDALGALLVAIAGYFYLLRLEREKPTSSNKGFGWIFNYLIDYINHKPWLRK